MSPSPDGAAGWRGSVELLITIGPFSRGRARVRGGGRCLSDVAHRHEEVAAGVASASDGGDWLP